MFFGVMIKYFMPLFRNVEILPLRKKSVIPASTLFVLSVFFAQNLPLKKKCYSDINIFHFESVFWTIFDKKLVLTAIFKTC